jgi:hypothetical protein
MRLLKWIVLSVLVLNAVKGLELYEQLKIDMLAKFKQDIAAYCGPLNGKYPSDTARVTCTGTPQVVGFPCLDCTSKFDWHDYDSVKRCASDPNCQKSGLTSDLVGFNPNVQFVGKKPILGEGVVYNNGGDTQDFHEFNYEQSEEITYTFTIETGTKFDYKTTAQVNVAGIGFSEEFGMEFDFSVSSSKTTVQTKKWATTEHVTLAPHTTTNVECFIWANNFRGDYSMNIVPKGKVLLVVWNPKGTAEHPFYSYWNEQQSLSDLSTWFPSGYRYSASLEGLEGVEVVCNKTVTPLGREFIL